MRPHKYQMSSAEHNAPCKVCGQPLADHGAFRTAAPQGRVTHPLGLSRGARR